MKIARFAPIALAAFAITLAGCAKEEDAVSSSGRSAQQVVSTTPVTVREVSFVNHYRRGSYGAVTQVRVTDEVGPSYVGYYLSGYHPDITVGLKAEIRYVFSKPNADSHGGTYITTFCVKPADGTPICDDQ